MELGARSEEVRMSLVIPGNFILLLHLPYRLFCSDILFNEHHWRQQPQDYFEASIDLHAPIIGAAQEQQPLR